MPKDSSRFQIAGYVRPLRKNGSTGFKTGLTVAIPDRLLTLLLVVCATASITGPWAEPTAPAVTPQELP